MIQFSIEMYKTKTKTKPETKLKKKQKRNRKETIRIEQNDIDTIPI
jgi:hypothetical protein